MDVNNQLIGAEILSLAEEDVPPEDLVFHKFYTNKMSLSSKPKKKKKKSADEEAAEELFDVDNGEVDGGDERICWIPLIQLWDQTVTMIMMIWMK